MPQETWVGRRVSGRPFAGTDWERSRRTVSVPSLSPCWGGCAVWVELGPHDCVFETLLPHAGVCFINSERTQTASSSLQAEVGA